MCSQCACYWPCEYCRMIHHIPTCSRCLLLSSVHINVFQQGYYLGSCVRCSSWMFVTLATWCSAAHAPYITISTSRWYRYRYIYIYIMYVYTYDYICQCMPTWFSCIVIRAPLCGLPHIAHEKENIIPNRFEVIPIPVCKKKWWGDVGSVGARELRCGQWEIQRRGQTEKFRLLWRHDVVCGSM